MCVWSESLCVCVSVWHGLYSPVSTSKWFQLQLHKHYSPKHPHAAIKHHNNTVCSQTSSRADIKLWMADITHTQVSVNECPSAAERLWRADLTNARTA